MNLESPMKNAHASSLPQLLDEPRDSAATDFNRNDLPELAPFDNMPAESFDQLVSPAPNHYLTNEYHSQQKMLQEI